MQKLGEEDFFFTKLHQVQKNGPSYYLLINLLGGCWLDDREVYSQFPCGDTGQFRTPYLYVVMKLL